MREAPATPWETLLSVYDRVSLGAVTQRLSAGAEGAITRSAALGLADMFEDTLRALEPLVTGDLELPSLAPDDGRRSAALYRARQERLSLVRSVGAR